MNTAKQLGRQDALLGSHDGWRAIHRDRTPTDREISDYWEGFHHAGAETKEKEQKISRKNYKKIQKENK